MKYKCLVLDHDDTVVNSTATIHYPAFLAFMKTARPDLSMSLEEYFAYNFEPGVIPLFRDICGLSPEEMKQEEAFWHGYVKDHIPQAYPGIRSLLETHKKEGGLICVISHSFSHYILRDYEFIFAGSRGAACPGRFKARLRYGTGGRRSFRRGGLGQRCPFDRVLHAGQLAIVFQESRRPRCLSGRLTRQRTFNADDAPQRFVDALIRDLPCKDCIEKSPVCFIRILRHQQQVASGFDGHHRSLR